MRGEASPHHLARGTQLIEIFRTVANDAFRQNLAFPRRCRKFQSLQLLDYVERAVDTVELRAGSEVLPRLDEAVVPSGADLLDLAPQRGKHQAVYACEHASVAPLIVCAGRETAAENLTLHLEARERIVHCRSGKPQTLREGRCRRRPG